MTRAATYILRKALASFIIRYIMLFSWLLLEGTSGYLLTISFFVDF
jgi:hypothetical protein